MVNRIESRGNQSRGNPIRLKIGDEMIGTLRPKQGKYGDFWLVSVKGGITGRLIGDIFDMERLDVRFRAKVRLKDIERAEDLQDDGLRVSTNPRVEFFGPKDRYLFQLVNQIVPASAAVSPTERVENAVAGSTGSHAEHIADKPIPSVGDLAAFRQYGEGLLRTNSRDLAQLKSSIKEWLGLAENISPRDSAIDRLVDKLKRRIYADGSKRRTTSFWDW